MSIWIEFIEVWKHGVQLCEIILGIWLNNWTWISKYKESLPNKRLIDTSLQYNLYKNYSDTLKLLSFLDHSTVFNSLFLNIDFHFFI